MKSMGLHKRLQALALVIIVLGIASLAQGQDATLTLTVASNSVAAGEQMTVWLNVLNVSTNKIPWTFPLTIERKIVSPQIVFDGVLEMHPAESNAVEIEPGAFVRREYVSTVPAQAMGRVVMEFPGLNLNRIVLDVHSPGLGDGQKTNGSFFTRYVKEVVPEEPDKGSGPGRYFKEHISGYEPMYFIAGAGSPNAKFQISFAYQLLNNDGPLAADVPALKGFHIAYTQTSLWDLSTPSAPFYDTSYQPEFFYSWENVTRAHPTNWFQLDLQVGLHHESNGKDGTASRSLNFAYFRPSLTIGRDDDFQITLQPRVWTYLGDLSDNPDIADYRGYVDLRVILGWKRGLELSALGRMGRDGDHKSLQLDLTYPMMRIFGSFSLYLDMQYFTGYGESLLAYNKKSNEFRVGLALYR